MPGSSLVRSCSLLPSQAGQCIVAFRRGPITPVTSDAFAIGFKQSIGASDPLRTGVYAKTLTFTLSTTNP